MSRWGVVLAGGIGSRFWPLSTAERPKQLLPLVSDSPLLRDTLRRLRPLFPAERTLILTNASLVAAIANTAGDVPRGNVLGEPAPAGTAAALAWAATEIARRGDPSGVMVCVHADWAIADEEGFRTTLAEAARIAEDSGSLVTVGVVPTRDDPGLGYIVPGKAKRSGGSAVAEFIEKPDRVRAAALRKQGAVWNSGIFAWRVDVFLRELVEHTPEISDALAGAGSGSANAERFFAAVKRVSVDVGLLERTHNVTVLRGDFGWDDIGTWGALLRAGERDAAGNVIHGTAVAREASGNVVHAEGSTVVLFGVDDLVVVSRDGLTLVTTVERSHDLKQLVDGLPASLRGT